MSQTGVYGVGSRRHACRKGALWSAGEAGVVCEEDTDAIMRVYVLWKY
jgi:hypothetical protein